MSKCLGALACALVVAVVVGRALAQEAADPFSDDGSAAPAAAAPAEVPATGSAPAEYSPAAAEERIKRTLDRPLRSPLSYTQVPLRELANQIQEEYDIPILIDLAALEAAAQSPDVEVTIELNNVTLRTAMELTLKQLEDLTYIIDQEVLLITTQDEAEQRLRIVVYRVDDLVRIDNGGSINAPDSYDFDPLIEILSSSVEKDSWEENGTGEGEMHSYSPGMLVITNTSRVHDQIARVLADMRRVKGDIEEAPATATAASQEPVTRGIALRDESIGDSDASREMVRDAIVKSVEWGSDSGDNTRDHFLYVLPQRVIVRHQPSVVRQVERVLADMVTNADRRSSRGGGGGLF